MLLGCARDRDLLLDTREDRTGGTRFLRVQADGPIKGANCVEGLKQSPIPG